MVPSERSRSDCAAATDRARSSVTSSTCTTAAADSRASRFTGFTATR